jgi:hypothetical protein
MKNIIILVALSTSLDANAQSMITGVVLDESGAPLADAQVAVGETNGIGDATNDEGRFALVGVPDGPQRARISHIGYPVLDTMIHPSVASARVHPGRDRSERIACR